jgi:hypothetical protein
MYKIWYKTEIWQSATFESEDDLKKAINLIEDNKFDEIFDPNIGFIENNMEYGTEYRLEPHENDNQSTIEAYIGDGCIWENYL